MTLFTLLAFTIAYLVAVLVPGPGRRGDRRAGLGGGFWSAMPMVLGILVGDLIYLAFALFGLAAIATYFGAVFTVVRWAGAAYLLYIAWQFWTAKPGCRAARARRSRTIGCARSLPGCALTMGNPKTIVFYLALLPTVVPLDKPITVLGLARAGRDRRRGAAAIGCGYAALAAWARESFTSPKAIRRLNRITGGIMAGAAAFVVGAG